MSSRMDKYRDNPEFYGSRSQKNEELYQEIIHDDFEDVPVASNAHVIGESDNNIDIEKIRELLEKKYPTEQKNKRTSRPLIREMDYEEEEEKYRDNEEEETKEYNINAILEKAKLDKDVDYERERLKKIRDTQYDILKGLHLEDEEEPESKVTSSKDDFMHLINTITEKEMTREMNPLDILTDLKGSDNTVVLDGVKEEIDKRKEIKDTVTSAVKETVKDTVKEEVKKEIDKTFYTNSMSFTKSDFDDFNDLKEDMESNKIMIRILLVLVALALIGGIVFLANHIFDLQWF